ncbi:MAG: type II toxin-antitoxin system VapC family toxin [Chloroflexi bacterium]|nr:type II toxin-antitoxin system VapC family toxin [Chloroflexota bacterium]
MIVLDTHALLWWVDGSRELSRRARRHIDSLMDPGGISVSSISCWEIGMLVAKGRLELTIPAEEWIARCESLPFLTFIPVDNAIALASTTLPGRPPSDPADRIIIATARSRSAKIVTKDERIRSYDVPTVW